MMPLVNLAESANLKKTTRAQVVGCLDIAKLEE
jgi:hypothetical protein